MQVTHNPDVTPVQILDVPFQQISVREWHPDPEGKLPAEDVHFVIVLNEETQLGLRFKSPETLGFFIEELIARRKRVWADAEPINPDAELEDRNV